MKHVGVALTGKVQGVGLRYTVKAYADDYGISGYARNLRDDTVFIEAEGDETAVSEFLKWLKPNPGRAEIDSLEFHEGPVKGHHDFQIF